MSSIIDDIDIENLSMEEAIGACKVHLQAHMKEIADILDGHKAMWIEEEGFDMVALIAEAMGAFLNGNLDEKGLVLPPRWEAIQTLLNPGSLIKSSDIGEPR